MYLAQGLISRIDGLILTFTAVKFGGLWGNGVSGSSHSAPVHKHTPYVIQLCVTGAGVKVWGFWSRG